ncbi:uncharacterized protein LOC127873520 [Dreissena polymorpha]|nr:uncharacterized protein LOC127873520 [Dreissena polymorpha]
MEESEKIQEMTKQNKKRSVGFKSNAKTAEHVDNTMVDLPFETLSCFSEIEVRTLQDSEPCHITSMLMLSPDLLLTVDHENYAIKLMDVSRNKTPMLLTSFSTESPPWDVAKIDQNHVAVTLPKEKSILILKTEPRRLIYHKTLKMEGKCVAITAVQGKMLVSFNSIRHKASVQLLNPDDGAVIEKLDLDGVQCVPDVAVNEEETVAFVSDASNNSIFRVSVNVKAGSGDEEGPKLKVLDCFEHAELKRPCCTLPLKDGGMLVCSNGNNQLLHVSPCLEKVVVAMSEVHELYSPRAICYDELHHRLFVSHGLDQNQQFRDYIKCLAKEP